MPARAVLNSVRRVTFDGEPGRAPEVTPFAGCMAACLDFLGEEYWTREIEAHGREYRLNGAYAYMMGVTGCAFRLSWKPGWHPDNVDIRNMSSDPEAPIFRAFNAAGYSYRLLTPDTTPDGIENMRRSVMKNIGVRRMPLLAFGVVGPPEACLITGYDESGEVLIGWSYFQDMPPFNEGLETEPGGQFRNRDWPAATESLIVWGDRLGRPPLVQVYLAALTWALRIIRTPVIARTDRQSGLAAYSAWAAHLLRDEDFAEASPEQLRVLQAVHDDAVGTVAEGRWYASQFLQQVAEDEPEMAVPLLSAAELYEAEHDLMWKVWCLAGGLGRTDAHAQKLSEPGVRREIVPLIEEARELDARAASLIKSALHP